MKRRTWAAFEMVFGAGALGIALKVSTLLDQPLILPSIPNLLGVAFLGILGLLFWCRGLLNYRQARPHKVRVVPEGP